jgi:hypothetical protein
MITNQRPLTILIAALGGEGGGVLTNWIVSAATELGFPVQSTSIPGVAQRTGATTYYIEILPLPRTALAGKRAVGSRPHRRRWFRHPRPHAHDRIDQPLLFDRGKDGDGRWPL